MNLREIRAVGSPMEASCEPHLTRRERANRFITDISISIPVPEIDAMGMTNEQMKDHLMHTACSIIARAFGDE